MSEGLTKGYATYWNAYNNVVFSDFDLEIGAVVIHEDCISPYYWLADDEVLTENEIVDKSFLILNENEHEHLESNIHFKKEPLNCYNDNGLYDYFYDYDTLEELNDVRKK